MGIATRILDPIRPQHGELGDDIKSGDMASVQGQAEIKEKSEGIEDAEIDRAEADEEVRKPKPAARPYTPTRAEVYGHEVTHLPYRSWCKHCVFGRGVS